MDYVVILEKGESSYGAYLPDIPDCVAVGETKEEAIRLIREAVELHLEALRKQGAALPAPLSSIEFIHVES